MFDPLSAANLVVWQMLPSLDGKSAVMPYRKHMIGVADSLVNFARSERSFTHGI
ncbi:MAG: hypothetical protein ABI407_17410 [Bradyrhizobium sp.]